MYYYINASFLKMSLSRVNHSAFTNDRFKEEVKRLFGTHSSANMPTLITTVTVVTVLAKCHNASAKSGLLVQRRGRRRLKL